jgi:hypothetical protein
MLAVSDLSVRKRLPVALFEFDCAKTAVVLPMNMDVRGRVLFFFCTGMVQP